MTDKTLIVLSLAGLSPSLVDSGGCPNLKGFTDACGLAALEPILPAVTLSMQATLTTGCLPAEHGIVGNGFFDRTHLEHRFWSASSGLLDRPRIWEPAGQGRGPSPAARQIKVAALFWWNFLGAPVDTYLNVAPFHLHDGATVSSCSSRPADLYPFLEKKLGPFPLHRFWGPAVSIDSSRWILEAALEVAARRGPDLLLAYLPHMDYSLQRSGPGSPEALEHLAQLDALLGPLLDRALEGGTNLLILSEYGIAPVSRAVSPNRILKKEGLFAVRRLGPREYPDLPHSRAFALCDHQTAHVYVKDPADIEAVRETLSSLPGMGRLLGKEGKREAGIDHPRAGDLVALSAEDAWFEYSWWDGEDRAPDYARTVDIHNKIGYDPLELIFDGKTKKIAGDPGLIRGSHGLVPKGKNFKPLLSTPFLKETYGGAPETVAATEVPSLLMKILERLHNV